MIHSSILSSLQCLSFMSINYKLCSLLMPSRAFLVRQWLCDLHCVVCAYCSCLLFLCGYLFCRSDLLFHTCNRGHKFGTLNSLASVQCMADELFCMTAPTSSGAKGGFNKCGHDCRCAKSPLCLQIWLVPKAVLSHLPGTVIGPATANLSPQLPLQAQHKLVQIQCRPMECWDN